jgi:hypothetical protein
LHSIEISSNQGEVPADNKPKKIGSFSTCFYVCPEPVLAK